MASPSPVTPVTTSTPPGPSPSISSNGPIPTFIPGDDIPSEWEMPSIPDDLPECRRMVIAFVSVALIWTIFRLYARRRSLWWDDLCAGLALLAMIIQASFGIVGLSFALPVTSPLAVKVLFGYINAVMFLVQLWFARAAILYSIIRITTSTKTAKILHRVALVFFLCCTANISMYIGHCEANPEWKLKGPAPACAVPRFIPIFQIAVGIAADALLVVLPINTLKLLTSAPALSRRLMCIFSASVLLTAATVVQAAITFKGPGMGTLKASLVEGFVAVIVCSLAIVSIAVMQLTGYSTAKEDTSKSSQTTGKNSGIGENSNTTIHLRTSLTGEIMTATDQIRFSDSYLWTTTGSNTYDLHLSEDNASIDLDEKESIRSETNPSSIEVDQIDRKGLSSHQASYGLDLHPSERRDQHAHRPRPLSLPAAPAGTQPNLGFWSRLRHMDVDAGTDRHINTWTGSSRA